ncbi:hypothetical protein HNY73_016517 [Argiope bruennichi]|uniref:Uncharacterized protein n=1 Tax=Argiope bruennichi TaxID=94029 RepID=A0A8T0ENZ7_ARGBR|nr:hypothetical protein HNY73_016517 [Argiope bruennichi]
MPSRTTLIAPPPWSEGPKRASASTRTRSRHSALRPALYPSSGLCPRHGSPSLAVPTAQPFRTPPLNFPFAAPAHGQIVQSRNRRSCPRRVPNARPAAFPARTTAERRPLRISHRRPNARIPGPERGEPTFYPLSR